MDARILEERVAGTKISRSNGHLDSFNGRETPSTFNVGSAILRSMEEQPSLISTSAAYPSRSLSREVELTLSNRKVDLKDKIRWGTYTNATGFESLYIGYVGWLVVVMST